GGRRGGGGHRGISRRRSYRRRTRRSSPLATRTRLADVDGEADFALPEVGGERGIEPGVEIALKEPGPPACRLMVAGGARLETLQFARPAETVAADGDRVEVG